MDKPIIKKEQYFFFLEAGIPYEGWVDFGDGRIAYALKEVEVVGVPFNKYNDRFFAIFETPVCVVDNTYVDTQSQQISSITNLQKDATKREIVDRLLKNIISCFQVDEFIAHKKSNGESSMIFENSSMIQIDVPNPRTLTQQKFATLKQKINDHSIKRTDFPYNIADRCRKEIDDYFACFDPKDPNYMWKIGEKPGFGESLIPIWGAAKDAQYHFQNGEYWYGTGYTLLAISDVFLVKSIFTGIAKGGLKALGKGYTRWSGYRSFYGKQGFAESGQHIHHWLWKRNGAISGNGFEWWAKNQMWNLKPVPKIEGMTYDAVHKAIEGKGFYNWPLGKRMYYGTPSWVGPFSISSGGRVIEKTSNINNE